MAKIHMADEEQNRLLDIQMKTSEGSFSNILTLILFIGIISVFMTISFILPDRNFSPEENRTLTTVSDVLKENFWDGALSSEFAKYMADQFPARDSFIKLKAVCEIAFGKGENNGVFLCPKGNLIVRNDSYSSEQIDNLTKNLTAVSALGEKLNSEGISFKAAIAGQKNEVLTASLPVFYGDKAAITAIDTVKKAAEGAGLSYIDLISVLGDAVNSDKYVYYRTDHHWTTLGAYFAAGEILSEFGKVLPQEEFFTPEHASDEFFGTTYSSSGFTWVKPDIIDFYRYIGDDDYTVTIDGVEHKGFYFREHLSEKDKYAAFLGGNNGRVDIKKNGAENRDKMVVVKDSFAHSMIPFLAIEYDIIMIDTRYYKNSVYRLCVDEGVKNVLFIANTETLSEAASFNILRMGLR